MATQADAALEFVNKTKRDARLRGRPRTSLPKAPVSSDPVTAALAPLGLEDAVGAAPKRVQAFISSFKAGRVPELVAS